MIARILLQGGAASKDRLARWAHNPEVVGSNPTPATNLPPISARRVSLPECSDQGQPTRLGLFTQTGCLFMVVPAVTTPAISFSGASRMVAKPRAHAGIVASVQDFKISELSPTTPNNGPKTRTRLSRSV